MKRKKAPKPSPQLGFGIGEPVAQGDMLAEWRDLDGHIEPLIVVTPFPCISLSLFPDPSWDGSLREG